MKIVETINGLFDVVDTFDPHFLFRSILAFCWIMFLWEYYLSFRQYLVEKRTKSVPKELETVIDDQTFQKSRSYALDKARYSFVHHFFEHIQGILILVYGGIPFLWNFSGKQIAGTRFAGEIPQSIMFMVYSMIFTTIISLPWTLYYTFVIEERHGFNKQTLGFFFKDQAKKFVVSVILTTVIVALLIYIIQIGGDYFFIYAWLFVTIIGFALITIYPTWIAPLFDKYTPLAEGDLKTKIEAMAESLKFPLYKLYVVEGSKRSAHSNAYFYGFFKSKRIVLFDTLIEDYYAGKKSDQDDEKKGEEEEEKETEKTSDDESKNVERKKGCNTDEILAVLAHELGHWKLNHNVKNIILSEMNTFFYFLIFAALMNRQIFYSAFGFNDSKPILIGFIIILQFLFAPYNELITFFLTVLSRRFEFQADAFAKTLQKAEYLKSALIKLNKDNLSFPTCDWLYSAWHHSHPPLIERLKALNEPDKKRD